MESLLLHELSMTKKEISMLKKILKVKSMNKLRVFVLGCVILLSGIPALSQVAVIANKSVSLASIDKETLKNIYMLDTKNLGALKVVLFDIRGEEGTTKSEFYNFIGTTPEAMRKVWLRAKLTGTGEPPILISEEEVVNKVVNTPGSIGYLSATKVKNNVKVVLTIE
jgi:ABC-type phosphate transport system substrate-binding protein